LAETPENKFVGLRSKSGMGGIGGSVYITQGFVEQDNQSFFVSLYTQDRTLGPNLHSILDRISNTWIN
jgi:hypothetical protein